MLPQSPSKIFKNDFRVWNQTENAVFTEILNHETNSGGLKKVTEIVLNEGANFKFTAENDASLLIFPVYGEIRIDNFNQKISAGETLSFNLNSGETISVENLILDNKADVLIFEFEPINLEKTTATVLNLNQQNQLTQISENENILGFVGIYNLRSEGFYNLKKSEKSIFSIVINGAFEFQNRLLENRDALLLWELEEIEFEALTENAIVLFLEV